MFTRERTFFIVVMRHPFGAHNFLFKRHTSERDMQCGHMELKQWLHLYETMEEDLKHLDNVAVLQFEQLLGISHNTTQLMVDRLFEFLHLRPNVKVHIDNKSSDIAKLDSTYVAKR